MIFPDEDRVVLEFYKRRDSDYKWFNDDEREAIKQGYLDCAEWLIALIKESANKELEALRLEDKNLKDEREGLCVSLDWIAENTSGKVSEYAREVASLTRLGADKWYEIKKLTATKESGG